MAGGGADSAADALPCTSRSASALPTARSETFRLALTFIVITPVRLIWVTCSLVKKRRTWPHGSLCSTEHLSCGHAGWPYHGVQGEGCIRNFYRFSDGIQLAFMDTYRTFTEGFEITRQS